MKERIMAETNTGETGLAPPNGEGQALAQPRLDRGQNPSAPIESGSAEPNSEPNVLISPQAERAPKERPIELVKPDSGISPSVEAYRKMEEEIALQERPVEIRGQVETITETGFEKLPPPMDVGDEIAELNARALEGLLEPEKEQRVDQLYGYIEEYAAGGTAIGLNYLGSGELINIETQLANIENQLHQFEEKYPALKPLFDEFDKTVDQIRATKLRSTAYESRLRLDRGGVLELSEEDRKEIEEKAGGIDEEFKTLQEQQKALADQITKLSGGDNVEGRKKLLDQYVEAAWRREQERYNATRASIETGYAYVKVPPEELEEDLEPTAEELAQQTKNLAEVLEIKDLVERSRPLELLFIEARRKGITRDIEADLNQKYEKYRKILTNEGIREHIREDRDRYMRTLEDESDWREVQLREELSTEDTEKFNSIRRLYAARGFDQMIAKRNRLLREDDAPLEGHRLDGEWNLNNQERKLQLVEKQSSSYEYRMGLEVILDDSTEDRFIASARQFAKDSYYGSPKFDPQEFLRRKSLLLVAIVKQGSKFFSNAQIRRIALGMEVEFDYPIMNFATDNYMSQLYQGMAENHFFTGGDERIENLATLDNGKFMEAVIELEEKESELILSPVGHKGQLIENIDAQGLLISLRRESLIRKLTNRRVRGATFAERQAYLLRMQDEMSNEEIRGLFEETNWEKAVEELEKEVEGAQDALNRAVSYEDKKAAQGRLNRAKREVYREKDAWGEARAEAESAITLALAFFHVTGESAKKSAPRFVMGNGKELEVEFDGKKRIEKFGDYIPLDWVVFFIKNALLDAIDESGDTLAKLDQRATQGVGVVPQGERAIGYTTLGFNALELQRGGEAIALLKRDGFKAKWKGRSLAEIIKDPRVHHMENNHIATYNSMRGRTITGALKQWIERGSSWLKYVLDVIDPKKELKETNQQQDLNDVRDKIELSRSLHYIVWKFTHKEWAKNDASHIAWIPYTNLLLQRNMYPQAWWLVDARHNFSRAADLAPSVPLWLPSIREYVGARSMKEFIQTRRKGKGAYDSWILNTWFNQFKGMLAGKAAAEGSISDQKGERDWGIFQKPTRSIDRLRAKIKSFRGKDVDGHLVLSKDLAEEYVLESLDIFGSWSGVATWAAYVLEEARGARGAGSAWKEIRRFWKDYFDWLKDPTARVPRRYLGGSEAYKSTAEYINFIDQAYWEYDEKTKEGETVANGILGKLDPTHRPV